MSDIGDPLPLGKMSWLVNQMKLLRTDFINQKAHLNNEIGIIKRRLDNMEKIAREILKRVSL